MPELLRMLRALRVAAFVIAFATSAQAEDRVRVGASGGIALARPVASELSIGMWGRVRPWLSVGADGSYLHFWASCETEVKDCPDATTVVLAMATPRVHLALDDGLELALGPAAGIGVGTWGRGYAEPGSHAGFAWGVTSLMSVFLTDWLALEPFLAVTEAGGDLFPDGRSRVLFRFGIGVGLHP